MTIGNTPRECDTSDTAISALLENEGAAVMSGTRIPTMGLRFVERDVSVSKINAAGMHYYEPKTARILQQRFTTTAGETIWEDVPVVKA